MTVVSVGLWGCGFWCGPHQSLSPLQTHAEIWQTRHFLYHCLYPLFWLILTQILFISRWIWSLFAKGTQWRCGLKMPEVRLEDAGREMSRISTPVDSSDQRILQRLLSPLDKSQSNFWVIIVLSKKSVCKIRWPYSFNTSCVAYELVFVPNDKYSCTV